MGLAFATLFIHAKIRGYMGRHKIKAKKNRLHIRRCHVCGAVNESKGHVVERCTTCQKALMPFLFCESTYEEQALELSKDIYAQEGSQLKVIYPPLVGIALYW